jgi:hypothetical protein
LFFRVDDAPIRMTDRILPRRMASSRTAIDARRPVD